MSGIAYENATRIYPGTDDPAVDNLSIETGDGELLVLVGPSGCGKSTSLRMLAGLEEVNSGRILIGSEDVTRVAAKDRDIAMVFQNYALYPHMSVADNMGFALKIRGVSKAEREQRVMEAAKTLGLETLLTRKPKALSGGQRQRVAMGRAIVRNPKVFLMDEPLSNLDAKLRVQTRSQISSLVRRLGVTTVYVTHDQTEALTVGDRIAVLKDGVLQQIGAPRELYAAPCNVFVASFIGSPAMNLFAADVTDGGVGFGNTTVRVAREDLAGASGQVMLGVRPEDVSRSPDPDNGLEISVDLVEDLGSDGFVYGHFLNEGEKTDIVVRVRGGEYPEVLEKIRVIADPRHLHLFDVTTSERLNGPVHN